MRAAGSWGAGRGKFSGERRAARRPRPGRAGGGLARQPRPCSSVTARGRAARPGRRRPGRARRRRGRPRRGLRLRAGGRRAAGGGRRAPGTDGRQPPGTGHPTSRGAPGAPPAAERERRPPEPRRAGPGAKCPAESDSSPSPRPGGTLVAETFSHFSTWPACPEGKSRWMHICTPGPQGLARRQLLSSQDFSETALP